MSSSLLALPLPLIFSKLSKELHPRFVLWYIKQFALEQYIERKKLEWKNRTSLNTNFIEFSTTSYNNLVFQFNISSNNRFFDYYIRKIFDLNDGKHFFYRFSGKKIKWYTHFIASELIVNNHKINNYDNTKIEINLYESPKNTFKRLFELSEDPDSIKLDDKNLNTIVVWKHLIPKNTSITPTFKVVIKTKETKEMKDFQLYNYNIFLLPSDEIVSDEQPLIEKNEQILFEPLLYLSDKYLRIIYKRMRSITYNQLLKSVNYKNSRFKESNEKLEDFISNDDKWFWVDLVGYEMTLFSLDPSKRLIILCVKK